jgi:hypothetical protein
MSEVIYDYLSKTLRDPTADPTDTSPTKIPVVAVVTCYITHYLLLESSSEMQ